MYGQEAERIRRVLGDRVARLEHGGSTSVPGLPAKPVIDIVFEPPDSSDEPVYVPDMEGAGYVLRKREPDWFEHAKTAVVTDIMTPAQTSRQQPGE